MADPQERSRELHADHQRLTAALAQTAEYSADVHEEAARVHEELGEARLLDPDALREHAQRDRDLAARERRRHREGVDEA